jgi:hypothetical protein
MPPLGGRVRARFNMMPVMADPRGDWWRPTPGSKWEHRLNFGAAAVTIITGSLALATVTWSLASTDDGRIKALLWWSFGVTAAVAFLIRKLLVREHADVRYGRCLEPLHLAHHLLRDASYARYIAKAREAEWKPLIEESLSQFQQAFSIAVGAPCHVSIKTVEDGESSGGRSDQSLDKLIVATYARSQQRPPRVRAGVQQNTVANNTDFRFLFSIEKNNRCWYHNDLLKLENYENPHWPDDPKPRNVPYRATMVWPMRKILSEGSATDSIDQIVHGFLTIDSMEPNVLVYERHFPLGAGYADHLFGVLWDPDHLRDVQMAIAR